MNQPQLNQLIEAAEHAVAVFRSMAERGAYPQELLPDDDMGNESPLFMGKQGLMFLINAIKAAKEAPKLEFIVGDMKTSAGMEYYTMMQLGDKQTELYDFKVRGRAEYTADELNFFVGNRADKPDIMDYES